MSKSKQGMKLIVGGGKQIFPSASDGCFLRLLFEPEDGGDMSLRNVVFSPKYTALQPGRPESKFNFICKNLLQVLQSTWIIVTVFF
jgi:hypothetical protein